MLETGTIVIKLPYSFFYLKKKDIGFRFNILAWSIFCTLFEPELEFHQIGDISKSSADEILEKMILSGAKSYAMIKGKKQNITIDHVRFWLNNMPAKDSNKFKGIINATILDSKIMGKSILQSIEEEKKTS